MCALIQLRVVWYTKCTTKLSRDDKPVHVVNKCPGFAVSPDRILNDESTTHCCSRSSTNSSITHTHAHTYAHTHTHVRTHTDTHERTSTQEVSPPETTERRRWSVQLSILIAPSLQKSASVDVYTHVQQETVGKRCITERKMCLTFENKLSGTNI